MSISVVIPTFNRAQILRKTLRGYAEQTGDHQICEVLVVDDGSKDDTASVAGEWAGSSVLHVRYLRQENSGPAAARNHAIREAKGDLILLGDDDIVPSSNMVAEHVAWHRNHPQPSMGVLGLVNWAAEMNATPFMEWSGHYGSQFNFGFFEPGMELDFRYAYGCNISVKKSFLTQNGVFDESIRSAGWEDLEFCYRLGSHGFRLFYNPSAVGYHHKFETFENARQRIEKLYRAWPAFGQTEAGQRFLEFRGIGSAPTGGFKARIKKLARPLKLAMMPLFRPLMDTRIPLPRWLYGMVLYHYVTPFSNFVERSEDQLSTSARLEQKPILAKK
jgi:GT2 family glycosyltransferase